MQDQAYARIFCSHRPRLEYNRDGFAAAAGMRQNQMPLFGQNMAEPKFIKFGMPKLRLVAVGSNHSTILCPVELGVIC